MLTNITFFIGGGTLQPISDGIIIATLNKITFQTTTLLEQEG